MSTAATQPGFYRIEEYLDLAERGEFPDDDRIELLNGMIVAMPPPSPPHDASINQVQYALLRKLGLDVNVRVQAAFVAEPSSVPLPDLVVLAGAPEAYARRHPSQAHLVIEVSCSSLLQDRLTKTAIYARAGLPCYWIVNVRDRCVEAFRAPDPATGKYLDVRKATGAQTLKIDAFPTVEFRADELLLPRGDPYDPI